jgi:hypothetical protein
MVVIRVFLHPPPPHLLHVATGDPRQDFQRLAVAERLAEGAHFAQVLQPQPDVDEEGCEADAQAPHAGTLALYQNEVEPIPRRSDVCGVDGLWKPRHLPLNS